MKVNKFIYFLLSLVSYNGYAYKFVIITDQENPTKAQQVKELFYKTYPFNQFDFEFEIKKVSSDLLNCASDPRIERNISCTNTAAIATSATRDGANQIFIIKNLNKYGGSGGPIPVMSTHTKSEPSMMIHEYLHTLGLSDEYKYQKSETQYYCKKGGANMAIITPNPEGYQNDGDARTQHMGQIPWSEDILDSTLITRNSGTKLGTDAQRSNILSSTNETNSPTVFGAAIGLYEGRTCLEAEPKVYTWNPGGEVSIMDQLVAGIGKGNEAIVKRALLSRGLKLKLNPPPRDSIVINQSSGEKTIDETQSSTKSSSNSIAK